MAEPIPLEGVEKLVNLPMATGEKTPRHVDLYWLTKWPQRLRGAWGKKI